LTAEHSQSLPHAPEPQTEIFTAENFFIPPPSPDLRHPTPERKNSFIEKTHLSLKNFPTTHPQPQEKNF
jgi:hypothetical protein